VNSTATALVPLLQLWPCSSVACSASTTSAAGCKARNLRCPALQGWSMDGQRPGLPFVLLSWHLKSYLLRSAGAVLGWGLHAAWPALCAGNPWRDPATLAGLQGTLKKRASPGCTTRESLHKRLKANKHDSTHIPSNSAMVAVMYPHKHSGPASALLPSHLHVEAAQPRQPLAPEDWLPIPGQRHPPRYASTTTTDAAQRALQTEHPSAAAATSTAQDTGSATCHASPDHCAYCQKRLRLRA
jgi:hypothetical protein